jgi:hypothetical protein
MSNLYNPQTVDGVTSYFGVKHTTIKSDVDSIPILSMEEEKRIIVDGETVTKPNRNIIMAMGGDSDYAISPTEVIPLLNFLDGSETDSTFTPLDMQNILYSLYVWKAKQLDSIDEEGSPQL